MRLLSVFPTKVAFLKRKEKDIIINLAPKKVREHDGSFKHRVTGKEFNSFVLETQNAIIQVKQEMLSFTGRVDELTCPQIV